MLKQRVIVSLIGISILCIVIWLGQPWFSVFVTIWGLIAIGEFYRIVRKNNIKVLTIFGIIMSAFFILHPYFDKSYILPALLTSVVILPLMYFLLPRKKDQAFAGWVWTIGGILYVGWLLSYLIQIMGTTEPYRKVWILFPLFVTFGSDSAAYLVGKSCGKHNMAPKISPKKTWEGAIGGIFGAVIIGSFFLLPTPFKISVPVWHIIILSILVSIFGQAGDLIESLFKRNMNVKDSSNLLPGHGGFLDRIDSIVFAGIVVYYYVVWIMPLLK